MADEEEFQTKTLHPLTGGYNELVPPDALPDRDSPFLDGVRFDGGLVNIDSGYVVFGQALSGYPQLVFEFAVKAGTSQVLLVTTDNLLKLNATGLDWDYIVGPQSTTLAVAVVATNKTLTVADSTGFTDGDKIGILLDDGTQHKSTLDGNPAGAVITIDDAIPSAGAIGNAVVEPPSLNGSIGISPTMVTMPAVDKCYLANGGDNLQEYDGTTLADASNLPNAGACVPKIVRLKDNHLILLNITETTAFPQRVRRCDTGDPTNWSTGVAGYNDLYESEEHIRAAENLGPYLIIYKENQIVRMEYVGSSAKLFNFDTVVADGAGALGTHSVIPLSDLHAVIGESSIYIYRGGFDVDDIDEKINRLIYGQAGILASTYRGRTQSIDVDALDEYWFVIPSSSATVADKLLRYNKIEKAWSFRTFADEVTGVGYYNNPTTYPWTGLSGTWAEQTWRWNTLAARVDSPNIFILTEGKRTQVYDFISVNDNGTAIAYTYDTKEIADPHWNARHNLLNAYMKGTSVSVYISTDRGTSWTLLESISPGGTFSRQRIWKQLIGRGFMFRFTGSGGGFGLEWVSDQYKRESEW